MNDDFYIIIPSRIGSTRLKNKPLINLNGETLIQRVFKNAAEISTNTFVATDSELIADNLNMITNNIIMTSSDHISGTDRVYEAASKLNLTDETLILNLQGDEPFIPQELISQMKNNFYSLSCDIVTASNPLKSKEDIHNPNCVMVEVDENNYAKQFLRTGSINNPMRHIGIYGYSLKTLNQLVSLKPTENEIKLKLEQLRFLENDFSIYVSNYIDDIPDGIDTADDVLKAKSYLLDI
jgi:3-deoxy-manno-octulosonate cytidylyltransferase (CMP-KDO synthetase)